jgi:hypothetical protein
MHFSRSGLSTERLEIFIVCSLGDYNNVVLGWTIGTERIDS